MFDECLIRLGTHARVLPLDEENKIHTLFNAMYPLTEFGKIDWDKIDKKMELDFYHPESIIPALTALLGASFDNNVYVDWDSGSNPMIQTTLEQIIKHFIHVRRASFDQFIFNLSFGYIIEVRFLRILTVGVVSIVKT